MSLPLLFLSLSLTMNDFQLGAFFGSEFYVIMDNHRQVIGRYFDANSKFKFDGLQAIGADAIVELYRMLPAGVHRVYSMNMIGVMPRLFIVSFSGDYIVLPQQESRRFHEMFLLNFTHPHARIRILNFRSFLPPATAAAVMEAAAMDAEAAAAKRFMEDYYRTFDANRADLVKVYRDDSLVNFSGRMIRGKEAVVAKLTSLQQCRHQISHIDCFPLSESGGVIVMVTGYMWLDGKPDDLLFNQSFHLIPAPAEGGSFYVAQQIWSAYDFNNHRAALA